MTPTFDRAYVSEYMQNEFDSPSEQHLDAAYDAMNRQNQEWWENDDERVKAGYQVFENVLLISVDEYKEGLSALLQRPVSRAELERNRDQLQEEVQEPLAQLDGLGILYRDNADIQEHQASGLETSLDASEDIEDATKDIFEDTDFEVRENEEEENSDSDYRIK